MKKRIMEEHLSAFFEDAVLDGKLGTPHFPVGHVQRELECRQGIPDFVISSANFAKIPEASRGPIASALATPSRALILSLLKPVSYRTEDYILRSSGLSLPVIRRSISELESLSLLVKSNRAGYVLSSLFPDIHSELWAFEVKVDKWRRALYQALQYKAFAHRVSVVIAERWVHLIERNVHQFRTLKVGVIALNEKSGNIRYIIRPVKRQPASRFHYLFALGKILNAQQKSLA